MAVGPEGGWRNANEQAVKDAFSPGAGFELKYAPAASPSDQQSQLDAFAAFVAEEVDAILLTPTEASGWEDSLKPAQAADIPVILIDRGVEAPEDLYVARIAPDNYRVAYSVGSWAVEAFPEGAKYFVLEGVPGLSVVTERNEGFDAIVSAVGTFTKVGAQTANWSTDEGEGGHRGSPRGQRQRHPVHLRPERRDGHRRGPGRARRGSGARVPTSRSPRSTARPVRSTALAAGDLSFVAQYNPFFGDVVFDVVAKTLAGNVVQSNISVESDTFDSPEAGQAALDAGLGF